ncbi:TPR-like protein [Dunaliella salina]|uniref:TPR-like protein n=1 Tax=Dunaliella salina TaxID=3046 RepID=A0ABQ7G6H1_DUNSA|nr:TPR-like protein [Dunaliella salina]|eukprot:KAF5830188.1 TPR-like protein [Dunaliella salina]
MAHKMLVPPAPLLAASLPTAQGLVQMPLVHPVLPQQHFRSLHLHNTSSTTTASLSAAASNAASSGSDCVLPRHHQIAHQPVMLGTTSTPKAEGGNTKASSSNRVPMQRRKARTAAPSLQAAFCDPSEGAQSASVQGSGARREWDPLSDEGLPRELCALADPNSPVMLPPSGTFSHDQLDNWRLDKLVATLGRSRSTWRRSLVLYEWLKASNKPLDDRLCTTLIRVCADHSDAVSALSVYEWMRAPRSAGGAALKPTTYTYTAAMRAALGASLLDRALQVWGDCQVAGLSPDSRMCITYMEVCTRLGQIDRALHMYSQMRNAPANSPMAPTVHAYTAAMRAATEGGRWARALDIWADLRSSGCQATGHAYAAAISACAAGQQWQRAVALFDDMAGVAGIRPDVVSCTALVTALASAGEADKAEAVVQWMLAIGLKPNVRTYTALLTAMGNAQQWVRAVELLFAMQSPEAGNVAPNAYTYSALLKALGEHGQWQLAEALFDHLEQQVLGGGLQANLDLSLTYGGSSSSSIMAGAGLQAQLAAARARLGALAVAAEALQQQQQDTRAAQLQQLQASSAAQLADLQAAGVGVHSSSKSSSDGVAARRIGSGALPASVPAQAQQPELLPPTHLGRWPSLGSQDGSSNSSLASEVGRSASRLSNDGSVNSEVSAASSSASSQLSSASLSTAGSSGQPVLEDSNRSWASPAQLNGLSLDLQLPQHPQQPTQAPQLSVPPRRLDASQLQLLQRQHEAALATATVVPAPAPSGDFSLFSSQPLPERSSPAAINSLPATIPPQIQQQQQQQQQQQSLAGAPIARGPASSASTGPVLNEVVCGALMLAYERAGKWQDAVGVLQRARSLGLKPNTVMCNTAISAAGKAGQLRVAEALFQCADLPDAITYEAFIAACGIAGAPEKAEMALTKMQRQGFRPREYAYCGLIAAYSLAGQHENALAVRMRAQHEGMQPSVHVYNASLAACERVGRVEVALELLQSMHREGVEPNFVTHQLMAVVGRQGVQSVEQQQMAAATLSAICAAAGSLLIKVGMF